MPYGSRCVSLTFRHFEKSIFFSLTGCFKANLDTLTNDYDKYIMSTEKIMVDLFPVYPEISFDNIKSEKNA